MKKILPLLASGALAASAAGAVLVASPGTAQAGNCTPFDGGGYTHYVCGKVFNQSNRSVAVAKDAPNNFYKWVAPGSSAGYDGYGQPGLDIDGFRIPAGCSMSWTYYGPAPSRYQNTSSGSWYKITDLTSVTIKSVSC